MASIGYARVSTSDQSTEMQLPELEAAGCERLFVDEGVSGTKTSRQELDKMLGHLRPGDEVVVWKLDRLGRNTRHLLEMLDDFKSKGIGFRSLRDRITISPEGDSAGDAMTRAMLTVMSAFAQLERDQISERTKAGQDVARSKGKTIGRPAADPAIVRRVKELKEQGHTIEEIGKTMGKTIKDKKGGTQFKPLSRATVYRYLAM